MIRLLTDTAVAALDTALALCGLLRSSQAPMLWQTRRDYGDALHAMALARLEASQHRRAREAAEDEARQLRCALAEAMKGWEA